MSTSQDRLLNDSEGTRTDAVESQSAGFSGLLSGGGGAWFRRYLNKMRGTPHGSPPRVTSEEVVWSGIGAFLGIALVGLLEQFLLPGTDQVLMIGSMGASAVLLSAAPRSPLAQPRNLVGGHVLSAIVGVLCYQLVGDILWLAAALSVASAIALMHLTRTLHPPGGATALIAVIGSNQIHQLGLFYALVPAGLSALLLLLVAMIVNNIPETRRYPEFWL